MVVVVDLADGRRGRLFADALAGLGHHVGDLQPGRLGGFLGLAGSAQAQFRRRYRGLDAAAPWPRPSNTSYAVTPARPVTTVAAAFAKSPYTAIA